MYDLVLYLVAPLRDEELALSPEVQEACAAIIATAVPLMVLCVVLFCVALCIMSAFNFLRGRRNDL